MSSTGFESAYGSTKMLSSNSSTTNSLSTHALQGNCMNKSGNNFLLTHQSFNKNMNMFFRKRGKQNDVQRVFYTIENSQKSWGALKEMLKNIFIEMSYYTENSNIWIRHFDFLLIIYGLLIFTNIKSKSSIIHLAVFINLALWRLYDPMVAAWPVQFKTFPNWMLCLCLIYGSGIEV